MPRKPKWDNLVPFGPDGNMISYITKKDEEKGIEWIEKYDFTDTLEFIEFAKGSSSLTLVLKSKTDEKLYYMFQVDLLKLLQTGQIGNGEVYGKWTFRKRGVCYGLTMAPGFNDEEIDLI